MTAKCCCCLQARVLTQRFNVTAFPALFVLRYGVPAPYTGPRNSGEAIAGFMVRHHCQITV